MTRIQSGKIVWTRELRLVVHLLNERHPEDRKYQTKIFNTMFEDYLDVCGKTGGASKEILRQQYNERKKPGPWKNHWQEHFSLPTTQEQSLEREQLVARIADVEAFLGVSRLPASESKDDKIQVAFPASPEPITESRQLRKPAERVPCRQKAASNATAYTTMEPTPSTTGTRARHAAASRLPILTATPCPSGKTQHPRMHGDSIPVYPHEQTALMTPPKLSDESVTHPTLSPLLFRYWDSDSQGKSNDPHYGFVSGLHSQSNLPGLRSVPDLEHLWTDFEQHIDRNKRCLSRFISTSNSFSWIVRQALIRSRKASGNCNISIIDTRKLEPGKVFHARPIAAELKKCKPFRDGAWMYGGVTEFLIWQRIPVEAVIKTINIDEIMRLANKVQAIDRTLRLHYLADKKWKRVRARMKAEKLDLLPGILSAIAKLMDLAGVLPHSPLPQIERAVSEIVQGWCLQPKKRSQQQWYYDAATFAHLFCKTAYPGTHREEQIKAAFLVGVQLGIGPINTLHNADGMRRMQWRARRLGLEAPADIVLNQLSAAMASITSYGAAQQQRCLEARPVPAIIRNEDPETPTTRPAKRRQTGQQQRMPSKRQRAQASKPSSAFGDSFRQRFERLPTLRPQGLPTPSSSGGSRRQMPARRTRAGDVFAEDVEELEVDEEDSQEQARVVGLDDDDDEIAYDKEDDVGLSEEEDDSYDIMVM